MMRRRGHSVWIRLTAMLTTITTPGLWLIAPPARAQAIHEIIQRNQPRRVSELKPGLTQCLTPAQWTEVNRQRDKEREAQRPAVRLLSLNEMKSIHGRGPYRSKYLSGTLPWHRSLRDANLNTGNLFKSFTDVQVTPAIGSGLSLQRTYNSMESRVGPFGIGWTHSYDLRMEEDQGTDQTDYDPTAPNPNGDTNFRNRTDTFGHKHKYHRDADGLYSPPPYLYDELSSGYTAFLVNGPPAVSEDIDKGMDGTIKHYIPNGTSGISYCDYIQDRYGNTTNLVYDTSITLPDGSNPLKTVTDPSGRTLTFHTLNVGTVQQPMWRVVQVDGPLFSVVYGYGTDGNLSAVTLDAATPAPGVSGVVAGNAPHVARTTNFGYYTYSDANGSESGLLNSVADPLGETVSYTYGLGSVLPYVAITSVTEPAGVDSNNIPRNQTFAITPYGFSTGNPLVPPDRLATIVLNTTTGYHLMVEQDPYLRTRIDSPYGETFGGYAIKYDSDNNIYTDYQYNFDMSSSGQSTYITAGTTASYGAHGNELTESDGTNSCSSLYYNASQYFHKQTITDKNGNTTTYGIGTDSAGTPGDPDQNIGDRGSVLWVKDALYGDGTLNPTGVRFKYTYDRYGRKASETNQNGVVTTYTYGGPTDATINGVPVGNLTQVIQDPGGNGHLNRITTLSYDVAGHVTQSVDPLGQPSGVAYNNLGQPTSASYPATANTPAESVIYNYDLNGRTHSVQDNRGTMIYTYEAGCDRVHSVIDPVTGTVSYTYNLDGQRASLTLPGGGTVTYYYSTGQGAFDAMTKDDPNAVTAVLKYIIDDQGRRVDYNYDCGGHLWSALSNQVYNGTTLVSDLETDYTYDGSNFTRYWLSGIKTTWNGPNAQGQTVHNLLAQNVYTFDKAGQHLSNTITDNLGNTRTENYAYDALNRLVAVNYGDNQTQGDPTNWQKNSGYTFDPMGNRLTKQDSVTGNESYSYNNANMLTGRNGANNYTNDLDGNTLTGGGRTNTWDSENRLAQCIYSNNGQATTSQYTYSADGLRRRSVITSNGVSTTTDFVLESRMFVRELRYNAGAAYNYATYLVGPRGPEYRRDDVGQSITWYVYDGLGSVLAEVAPNGSVIASRKYDVYGGVRASTGKSTSKHKFVGSLGHPSDDESGLIYMQARYMDPATGRFESQDSKKSGFNWFIYTRDNPVNMTDKDGHDPDPIGILSTYLDALFLEVALIAAIFFVQIANLATDSLTVENAWGDFMHVWSYGNDPSSFFDSDVAGAIKSAYTIFSYYSGDGALTLPMLGASLIILTWAYSARLEFYINQIDNF